MLSAMSAEALKLSRHKATWFLVWIYPIALAVLMLLGIAFDLAEGNSDHAAQATSAWIAQSAYIWLVPTSGFGRYLIAAYLAVAIAGE